MLIKKLMLVVSAAMLYTTQAAGPSVGIGYDPDSPTTDSVVRLYCNPSGGAGGYVYSWSGDDGVSGDTQSVLHRYSTAGTYTANVTVTDSAGQSSTASMSFAVQDAGSGSADANTLHFTVQRVLTTVKKSNGTMIQAYRYVWSGDFDKAGYVIKPGYGNGTKSGASHGFSLTGKETPIQP